MKKILVVLLALMLCVGFAACSAQKTEDTGGDKLKVGMLTKNNYSTEEFAKVLPNDYLYFDNLTDMEMALTSGTIDRIYIGESTGKYMVSKNNELKTDTAIYPMIQLYAMLLRKDDQALCDQISGAITKLEENGTLAELQKKYIDGVIAGDEPGAIELSAFDGSDTIKVAVTGDLPPMDYVSADGKAAGFNVALLKAISEELKVNIELVQVNTGARAVALSNGKADVVFWSVGMKQEDDGKDSNEGNSVDLPENAIKTVPYYSEKDTLVINK